jgi:hypothetical protein
VEGTLSTFIDIAQTIKDGQTVHYPSGVLDRLMSSCVSYAQHVLDNNILDDICGFLEDKNTARSAQQALNSLFKLLLLNLATLGDYRGLIRWKSCDPYISVKLDRGTVLGLDGATDWGCLFAIVRHRYAERWRFPMSRIGGKIEEPRRSWDTRWSSIPRKFRSFQLSPTGWERDLVFKLRFSQPAPIRFEELVENSAGDQSVLRRFDGTFRIRLQTTPIGVGPSFYIAPNNYERGWIKRKVSGTLSLTLDEQILMTWETESELDVVAQVMILSIIAD